MDEHVENSRREFIRKMGAASLAAAATTIPAASFLSSCQGAPKINSKADTVILLWMAGGMAHTETFDPGGIDTPSAKL